jgi:nucleoside-diphosphate-sugar epimerase
MATLVTGGTGMLGSAIVRRLVQDEGGAVVLDISDTRFSLTGRGVDLGKVQIVIGDASDDAVIARVLDSCDIEKVIHLSAAVGEAARNPLMATRTNCLGTVGLLEECHKRGISRVITTSSVAVYAPQDAYPRDQIPLTEDCLFGVWGPGDPFYSAGKIYLEAAGHWYRNHHGMEIAGMRPAYIASAGRRTRPPLGVYSGEYIDGPACGRPLHLPSSQGLVSYVYVEDVVEQYMTLLRAPADLLGAGPFFNTGGTTFTVAEIMDTLRGLLPDAKITFGSADEDNPLISAPTLTTNKLFAGTFGVDYRYDLVRGLQAQIAEARSWPGLFADS